jgi:hypothetical protein
LIIAIPILLSIFQIKTNDFDSASRKIPLLVVLFYSRYLGAYLLAYLNDLITSKSFLNGDAELNGIRRIFRRIELSLLASILVSFVFLIR